MKILQFAPSQPTGLLFNSGAVKTNRTICGDKENTSLTVKIHGAGLGFLSILLPWIFLI